MIPMLALVFMTACGGPPRGGGPRSFGGGDGHPRQGGPAAQGGGPESVDQRVNRMKERLNLSPEEEGKVRSILEGERKQMDDLRKNFEGWDREEDARQMRSEIRRVLKDTDKRFNEVLTEDQKAEYEKMKAEDQESRPPRWPSGQGSRSGGGPGGGGGF